MEMGPALWLALLTIGVAALGIVMAYAAKRTANRTAVEKRLTEAATREEYRREDQDRS